MLSDLRESGSIEQDADIIFFYIEMLIMKRTHQTKRFAECIELKPSRGTGTVNLAFIGGIHIVQGS